MKLVYTVGEVQLFIHSFITLGRELNEKLQFRFYQTLKVVHNMSNVVHYGFLIVTRIYEIMGQPIHTQIKVMLCEMVADLLICY